MMDLFENLKIKVNEKLYLKDPETSVLGKKILQESILLIDEIGFENFTFKKLGEKINSNESSIYRYFENKHKLLLYLSYWYWSWIEYKLILATTNITDAKEKLKKVITVVTEKVTIDTNTEYINESILNKIIIAEFTKTLQTKEVDQENKEGFFLIYERIINRIVTIVNEVNPEYPYAKSLVSTIVEGNLHQHFLKEHLKTITDCGEPISTTQFYLNLTENVLR
ncbi:TetR/AcrR family transcriptional regulator [Flavobacterium seoulense]